MGEAFFDVDGTIYQGYSTTNFNNFLGEVKGIRTQLAFETQEMVNKKMSEGVMDYREGSRIIIELTGLLLQGMTVEDVKNLQNEFGALDHRLFPWVGETLSLLKEKGFSINLVSGAPTVVLEAIAHHVHADNVYGSVLEIEEGKFTGRTSSVLNFEAKDKLVSQLVANLPNRGKIFGFGDSEGDIHMLNNVDTAFLYEPRSEEVRLIGMANKWLVVDRYNILQVVRDQF